jgi:hypothetical protein
LHHTAESPSCHAQEQIGLTRPLQLLLLGHLPTAQVHTQQGPTSAFDLDSKMKRHTGETRRGNELRLYHVFNIITLCHHRQSCRNYIVFGCIASTSANCAVVRLGRTGEGGLMRGGQRRLLSDNQKGFA